MVLCLFPSTVAGPINVQLHLQLQLQLEADLDPLIILLVDYLSISNTL
jgi:hypothetical protein